MRIDQFLTNNPTFDVSDLLFTKNSEYEGDILKTWDESLKKEQLQEAAQAA